MYVLSGRYAARTVYVELFLLVPPRDNTVTATAGQQQQQLVPAQYQGLYVLMEKLEVSRIADR